VPTVPLQGIYQTLQLCLEARQSDDGQKSGDPGGEPTVEDHEHHAGEAGRDREDSNTTWGSLSVP